MRRPPGSVRSMLHRLAGGGRKGREWFTKSSLATALHIRPDEVQKWMDNGWLKHRVVQTSGLKMQTIDPDDFCDFVKRHGRQAVGRRLSYEGLRFVRDYVFPSSHADLLSVRGTYKKRATGTSHSAPSITAESANGSGEESGESASDQSGEDNSEV